MAKVDRHVAGASNSRGIVDHVHHESTDVHVGKNPWYAVVFQEQSIVDKGVFQSLGFGQ